MFGRSPQTPGPLICVHGPLKAALGLYEPTPTFQQTCCRLENGLNTTHSSTVGPRTGAHLGYLVVGPGS